MKTGVCGNPGVRPEDESPYSHPKSRMSEHIHPVRKVIMTRQPGAGVINWHVRD
jgi:hypothetical protein